MILFLKTLSNVIFLSCLALSIPGV
uniref:Uncharacterized protein n=1 Tax=Anguilla anguilla TaxID=7936 RepID=A0A0E9PPX6_ANGAN